MMLKALILFLLLLITRTFKTNDGLKLLAVSQEMVDSTIDTLDLAQTTPPLWKAFGKHSIFASPSERLTLHTTEDIVEFMSQPSLLMKSTTQFSMESLFTVIRRIISHFGKEKRGCSTILIRS